jgi:hypothetical protein
VGVFEEIPIVVLHVIFGQDPKLDGCRNPTDIIQNPSERKIAEGLSTESRASVSGWPLRRSGYSKRAEFSAEWMVGNGQYTVRK